MKKNANPTRKLEIKRETLKRLNQTLTDSQLKEAAGGVSANCTYRCEPGSVSTEPC